MTAPITPVDYILGYWLFTKQHPDFPKKKFCDFIDLAESGIVSLNIKPGISNRLVNTIEETSAERTEMFSGKVYLEMWNDLVERYEYYDQALKTLFRVRMYDYKQFIDGKTSLDYFPFAKDQYPEALTRLQEFNTKYFNFEPLSCLEIGGYRKLSSRFEQDFDKFVLNLDSAFPVRIYKTPLRLRYEHYMTRK